jgi:hypothetical protein
MIRLGQIKLKGDLVPRQLKHFFLPQTVDLSRRLECIL